MAKRVVIVGGVAGGMSCAARIKRLDDLAEVIVFEKGNDVSYANCGMPYYVGGIIRDRASLNVQTPKGLTARYDIHVRVRHEVTRIDRTAKQVEVINLDSGETILHPYDVLVLSPGAAPVRPPIPGADGCNAFVLNDLADMDSIQAASRDAKHVCVVGAGFIGLELVESFRTRGLEVSLVELANQVLPSLDWEMTQPILQELRANGVAVFLGDSAASIEGGSVRLKSGKVIESDFVCLCVGVRPTSQLARDAGLALGERGHICVDDHMRTSDPDIFAVGDVIEVRDFVSGEPSAVPLAGPANRQGRVAADVICGRDSAYRDAQGTGIVKVFHVAASGTGWNERRLKVAAIPYHRIYVHPTQHPRYYPGAHLMGLKMLFSPEGKIYGAQIVGSEGVEVLIDVLATAMRAGLTVQDLEHLELAYSPQWGNAKHGINMAGFVATNLLNGDVEVIEADQAPADIFWLDVRTIAESEAGVLPGALVIPVDDLRKRMGEIPRDREIGIYCAVGLRGYVAYRLLKQHGFNVRNLNGGYRTWSWFQTPQDVPPPKTPPIAPTTRQETDAPGSDTSPAAEAVTTNPHETSTAQQQGAASVSVRLDVCGMQCPGPLVKVKEAIERMQPGQVLEVTASDPGFAADAPAWCRRTGNPLIDVARRGRNYVAQITKGPLAVTSSAAETCARTASQVNKKTIICFSNDLDRVLAAFVIANGAAAMGSEVTIFFTFWGLNVLRKESPPSVAKGLLDRMFGMMMPKGPERLKLSKLNMGGMGTAMMKHVMKTKNVMTLPELVKGAQDAGVRLVACSMSMDVMGIAREELIDGVEIAGVGHYLGNAEESNVNLFI